MFTESDALKTKKTIDQLIDNEWREVGLTESQLNQLKSSIEVTADSTKVTGRYVDSAQHNDGFMHLAVGYFNHSTQSVEVTSFKSGNIQFDLKKIITVGIDFLMNSGLFTGPINSLSLTMSGIVSAFKISSQPLSENEMIVLLALHSQQGYGRWIPQPAVIQMASRYGDEHFKKSLPKELIEDAIGDLYDHGVVKLKNENVLLQEHVVIMPNTLR